MMSFVLPTMKVKKILTLTLFKVDMKSMGVDNLLTFSHKDAIIIIT